VRNLLKALKRHRPTPLAAFFLLLIGCTSSDQIARTVQAKNDSHIKQLANLYYAYQRTHGWRGPSDESTLKQFAQTGLDPKKLIIMNITRDNLDDIFISDRDHEPFRVKYNLEGDQSVPSAVVFEDKGIGGQRQVAFNIGTVQLVTDDEYQKLWDDKGNQKSFEPASK
jgi:hypothetical protein